MCSSGTPHPAIPPRPGPRLTAPPHPHHPAPPPLSLPITPRQPRVPSPTSPRPPFPGGLTPLRPAPPLSAETVGSPNVSNRQYRCWDSPPRHRRASNSASVLARRRTAPPSRIRPFPLRPHVPADQDKPAPDGAAPAIRLHRGPHANPHRLTPLRPAPPLSAATVGSPMFRINNTAAGILLRGTARPRTAASARPTPHSPAPPNPSRLARTSQLPTARPRRPPSGYPAAPTTPAPLHPLCPPLFPTPEQWGLKTQQKLNARK